MIIDLRVVSRHLGLLLLVLSGPILAVALFGMADRGFNGLLIAPDVHALLLSALASLTLGGGFVLVGRKSKSFLGYREALLLVTVSWVVGAGIAAVPYRVWSALRPDGVTTPHDFDNLVNCYFEAISGLTTTGATIVESLATLPRSLLLWRALTQWLGGLGIVVLFVAVLSMLGSGGRRIYQLEAPGPTPEGVRPRIQDTARVLWLIYCGLSVAEVLALRISGMGWFDATCHTFTTLATGGFGTLDNSVAGFSSPMSHWIIIIFMILAGINFSLYHLLLQKRWRKVFTDPELRCYLGIMAAASVIVCFSVWRNDSLPESPNGVPASGSDILRHSLFQVVSIQTTTGFASADFDQWGFAAKATLLVLMFVGGSAGSTGGGMKVIRIMIAAKVLWGEMERVHSPRVVRAIRVGRTTIDANLKIDILVYFVGIALLFGLGTAGLMLFEAESDIDITTAATAAATTLNNVGPGLARVGATQNFSWLTAPSKILLSLLMILGRLEVFTILVLFTPRFWRRH